jgi:hypothetical protein
VCLVLGSLEDIEQAAERGVRFIAPVPKRMQHSGAVHAHVVDDWIADMTTDEAKQRLRARASLCELANAHIKGRYGIDRVLVRGTAKVTCVALLAAIAFNLLQHAQGLLAGAGQRRHRATGQQGRTSSAECRARARARVRVRGAGLT